MNNILVLFSNPPDQTPIRLDKEDKLLRQISSHNEKNISLKCLHASDIESIHTLITESNYNIIHFSGHGNSNGIYLDKKDFNTKDGELVSASRLLNLLDLAEHPPLLLVLLCCYSSELLETLVDAAPFVISCDNEVSDECCLQFVNFFYTNIFKNKSIETSYEHAIQIMRVNDYDTKDFKFSRRSLIRKGKSLLVKCRPSREHDTIFINLDAVKSKIASYGLSEEEFSYIFSQKLKIHYWIFNTPRDRVLIPVGKLLFGEFKWKDAKDIVDCTNLFKIKKDVEPLQLEIWAKLLVTYNDMASMEYRDPKNKHNVSNIHILERSCNRFKYLIDRHVKPSKDLLKQLGFTQVIPHYEFALIACDYALDYLKLEDMPQTVLKLELCLTHLHEIIDEIQPPTE
ncbi:MAG: CHAT domain-containing protein [Victivallaceae bacterium]|nr:CHAT domain-containing protein [Victivallaceae bacterium]